MDAIKVSSLVKVYSGGKRALDGLSFGVGTGTVTGFVGRNGAGKTTAINILAGIVKAGAGEVEILGERIVPGDWRYKSKVGFVLERPNYVSNLTGREYLEFACVMQGIPKKESGLRIGELLEFLELEKEEGKPIRDYSKGMKKKISLAAALIHNPELLILDEPLEGVDPVSASEMKKLLVSLSEKGKTIFISSHELGTVEKICGDMIIIDRGGSLYHGSMQGLRDKLGIGEGGKPDMNLEELFVKLVGEGGKRKGLSWM